MDKNEVYSYLHEGISLDMALKTAFTNINKYEGLGLHEDTIDKVSNDIAKLRDLMSVDNVIEIYSTFVHRYIYRNGANQRTYQKNSHVNVSDQKVLFAVNNLDLEERKGYFLIKPDRDKIDKKYPD